MKEDLLLQKQWLRLERKVIACETCSRLRTHCQQVAEVKRKSYRDQSYWGRPVPNFGSLPAELLIVGLAPAAHGANRTGRMFTGDRSGDWLYRALHRFGFANQPQSIDANDGLKLQNCAITSICHCAPPDNKPTTEELSACQPFFFETMSSCQPRVIVALGGLAWKATVRQLIDMAWYKNVRPQPKFAHGAQIELSNNRWLLGSYHPSQQNTFTRRLTEKMLDDVFRLVQKLL